MKVGIERIKDVRKIKQLRAKISRLKNKLKTFEAYRLTLGNRQKAKDFSSTLQELHNVENLLEKTLDVDSAYRIKLESGESFQLVSQMYTSNMKVKREPNPSITTNLHHVYAREDWEDIIQIWITDIAASKNGSKAIVTIITIDKDTEEYRVFSFVTGAKARNIPVNPRKVTDKANGKK